MKLFIDTSNAEEIVVGLGGDMHTEEARKEKSQKLLPTIVKLLKEKGMKMEDVTEIEVNTGPGSKYVYFCFCSFFDFNFRSSSKRRNCL